MKTSLKKCMMMGFSAPHQLILIRFTWMSSLVLRYQRGTKTIHLRYWISFIDVAQAHKNLQREVADYSKEELKCIIGTQVMKKRYICLRIINF
jgi:hypothetical protein